jgi:Fe-S-cluster containining protein
VKFPCTSCGLCCKKIASILSSVNTKDIDEVKEFPYKALDNGTCEMYLDNKCSVYESRPNLCNVDYMAKKYSPHSYDDFIKLNIQVCNSMIKEEKLDEKFLIVIEETI